MSVYGCRSPLDLSSVPRVDDLEPLTGGHGPLARDPQPSPGSAVAGGEQSAGGTVTEVDSDAFVLETGDGSDLRLHMAQDTLANLNLSVCDGAQVTYHQDAGMLIADTVNDTGPSNSGDCTRDQNEQDAVGRITEVTFDSVAIGNAQEALRFSVDPTSGVTDGFELGDLVDVSYVQNADGSLTAGDVEYIEQDASGAVTAVSDGTVTIVDGDTGQPATFTADPGLGMFDGVAVGDELDITYHQSGGQPVVDAVSDDGPAN